MPEIRVQDEQGNIHVFPDGSTPDMIARAMGAKPQTAHISSRAPSELSSPSYSRGFAGPNDAQRDSGPFVERALTQAGRALSDTSNLLPTTLNGIAQVLAPPLAFFSAGKQQYDRLMSGGQNEDPAKTVGNLAPAFLQAIVMHAGDAIPNLGTISGPELSAPWLTRAVKTSGKVLANQSIKQPLKAVSQIPEYWRSTSPQGELLSATRQAAKEGRANLIPTKVKPETQSPSRAPTWRDATRQNVEFAGEDFGDIGNAQRVRSGEPQSIDSPTFLPEPREPFRGETEGYMASVPRKDLVGLAKSGKPGAGKQLQQLGEPVIYIPKGAEIGEAKLYDRLRQQQSQYSSQPVHTDPTQKLPWIQDANNPTHPMHVDLHKLTRMIQDPSQLPSLYTPEQIAARELETQRFNDRYPMKPKKRP